MLDFISSVLQRIEVNLSSIKIKFKAHWEYFFTVQTSPACGLKKIQTI
jgi:hypothetical protein